MTMILLRWESSIYSSKFLFSFREDGYQYLTLDSLSMLAYIAGSKGYVSFLKNHNEMQTILEEVEKRVLDMETPDNIRQKAAEIFFNLTKSNEELGIDMAALLPGSLIMVAEWCTMAFKDAQDNSIRPFAEITPLLSGITTMLLFNPEQSVHPLSRHGRAIMKLAKSRYRRISDRSQRHVLNQYFLCHLYV